MIFQFENILRKEGKNNSAKAQIRKVFIYAAD